MAAQFHRNALQPVGRQLHQVLADRDGAGEADLADDRAGQQVTAHRVRHAVDKLRRAFRDARIVQRADERARAAGRFLRRLGDHGIACRQRRAELLCHQIGRKIPRTEGGDRADRLADHHRALPGGPHQHAAVLPLRFLCRPVEDLRRAHHLALRFGERLALLHRHGAADPFGPFAQQCGGFLQDRAARIHVHRPPRFETARRCRQRRVEIGGGRQRHLADRLARGGVDHGVRVAPVAGQEFAVDIEGRLGVVGGGHASAFWSRPVSGFALL